MNMTQKNFMKSSISQPANLEAERALDIFKLGLIILECAVGGFENFEQSSVIHETLKAMFSEEGQKVVERDNVCCLIHSEAYLLEWALREEKVKREQLDPGKVLPYLKILKDRFSMQFLNFLCGSLRLSHGRRSTIDDMLGHLFLRSESKECHTVNVSLQDLLLISKLESDPMIESVILFPRRSRRKDLTSSLDTSCRSSVIARETLYSAYSKITRKRYSDWASTSACPTWAWGRDCTRRLGNSRRR